MDRETTHTDPLGTLTCKELVELVTEYLEGGLDPVDRTRFEEHLITCPPCQIHLDQVRRTIEVVGRLTEDQLSEAAQRDLLQAFRDWKSG
jgi:anti-sigma factor RsiW